MRFITPNKLQQQKYDGFENMGIGSPTLEVTWLKFRPAGFYMLFWISFSREIVGPW
jgi:hypothetical protein